MQLGKILPVVAVCVLCSVMAVNEVHGQTPTGPQVVTSLEHDQQNGQHNKIVHLKNNIYVLYYVDSASCYLKTFEVGDKTIRELDDVAISNRCYLAAATLPVSEDRIIVLYPTGRDSFFATYDISDDGTITKFGNSIDSGYVFFNPSLFFLADDLLYASGNGGGTISTSGTWAYDKSTGVISGFVSNDALGYTNQTITLPVDRDTIIHMAERGDGRWRSYDMNLTTKQVTEVNNVRFATYNRGGGFAQLGDNLFVSSYVSNSNGGATLKTVNVSDSGSIITGGNYQLDGAAPVITLANGGAHAIERLADNRFTVAWPGSGTNGKLQTFTVAPAGIAAVTDSDLTFSTNAKWISMARDESKTVLAYAGADGDGYITLVKPPEVAPGAGTLTAHAQSASIIRFTFSIS